MKTNVLILSLLTSFTALAQTQPSRIPPWMLPATKAAPPRETNAIVSDLQIILSETENMLERGFRYRKGGQSAPQLMSLGSAAGGGLGESAVRNSRTEAAGPATILAENLGVVTGENLGISLGQNLAVPTFQQRSASEFSMTSEGAPVPDQQAAPADIIVSVHSDSNVYGELASIRDVVQTLLTVQQLLDRAMPTIARLNAVVPKEPALWALTAPFQMRTSN